MSRTWFTSDQHFGHANVIGYCSRPFASVEEMNAEMVKRWNEVVQEEDTVYCLGDFSMNLGQMERFAPLLKGKKFLVPGNHDACHPRRGKKEQVRKRYADAGFTVLNHTVKHTLSNGQVVTLCHIPHTNEDPRYPEWKAPNQGGWLLCGHVHERWQVLNRQINVGVDQFNFYPVAEEELIALMDSST